MNSIEMLSAIISTVSAVIAVVVAAWAIYEGRRLYTLQTNPEVVLYLERNDRYPDAVDLIIANIVAAPASNVEFEYPIDSPLLQLFEDQREKTFVIDNGIVMLMPGQKYRFAAGIFRDMNKSVLKVCATYYRSVSRRTSNVFTNCFLLRPRELDGYGEWTNHQLEALKSVKKAADALVRGKVEIAIKSE